MTRAITLLSVFQFQAMLTPAAARASSGGPPPPAAPLLSLLALFILAFAAVLFRRFGRKALLLLGATGAGLLVCAVAVELAAQAVHLFFPVYQVLHLEPDPVVGWKEAPGLGFTWTGPFREFGVPVRNNSAGFRDLERPEAKPAGTRRVALLGDSFVEALQVPLEKTAGQLLERRLNDESAIPYQVLNFGVSNYSVGQYLLVWEEYASRYRPDAVVALVAGIQMLRTVRAAEEGAFPATAGTLLAVRPVFGLEDGRLVRKPAPEFEEFVRVQEKLVAGEFGGRRSRRKQRFLLGETARRAARALGIKGGKRRPASVLPKEAPDLPTVFLVNLKVLDELARDVAAAGGRLAVADAGPYLDPSMGEAAETLRRFCASRGIGYIPLFEALMAAEREGTPTRWRRDWHFNEDGNRVFAEAVFNWVAGGMPGSAP